jgi:DNA-binding transcriptional ArsR family regulator
VRLDPDPDGGWLTAKRAARHTKVERVTASRDLARLEELRIIEKDPDPGGRSTRYRVRLGEERLLRLVEDIGWP